MFEKLSALFALFRKGSEVANAEAWKSGQITGTVIAGVILAAINVAKAFGHPLPIDADTANALGGGILAGANVVLTCITSARAGLLPAATTQPDGESDPVQPDPVPAVAEPAAAAAPTAVPSFRQAADGSVIYPPRRSADYAG